MLTRFRMFIQRSLIAGILATLPLAVTYWFLTFVFKKFSGFFQPYLVMLTNKYDIILPDYTEKIISFSVIIIVLFFIGLIAKNYLGKKILGMIQSIAENIPIVRGVYSSIRQIVDAFQTTSGSSFKKVVMIEYPRKGIYSFGFITKDSSEFLNKATGEVCVNIFIPTTPNPTSGFILIVPKADVIDPGIPIEHGIKFIISAGLVEPFAKPEEPIVSSGQTLEVK
ncbi:MAG: hypothetical protein C0603_01850 [Denitrovibrio sp.]|nr:MAG: hypothetical protein C0603_01850 [Denitrovibrio sp.]